MNRILCILLWIMAIASNGQAQSAPNIQTLYDEFVQISSTRLVSPRLYDLAKNDQGAQDFLAAKLPPLIASRATDIVWIEAVRLSGQLRLAITVPALKQALSRGPIPTYDPKVGNYSTFSRTASLKADVVGRALADIGDPAVPAVTDVMTNGDVVMRRRAFWILSQIGSPAAQQALRDHLPSENDLGIRKLIQKELQLTE